ncbi:MAG: hypothetical protein IPM95_16130 [Sphingobacteriales bacterium]|nr:hypothetical protein [Sphingobacteriales bacterium]
MKNPPSITFKATAVLAIVLMVFACTKESTPSLIDELAKSNWRKASILVSTDSVIDTIPVVDILTSKPDCAKDNIWKFNAVTNTFQLDEGPTKCNVLDPDIKDQGIIEEQNGGELLRVAGTGTNEIWEIESRTTEAFRVSYFARTAANKQAKFRVVFEKI